MNIDVVGRIRPALRGEGSGTIHVENNNQVAAQKGGRLFSFQQLHTEKATNYDVFRQSIEPMTELWLAGYNTCLIVTGESGSGKTYTVAGETATKTGIVPMILENLFASIGEDDDYMYENQTSYRKRVSLQVYEVYNELIKDLLQVPGINTEYLNTDYLPSQGPHVRDITEVVLKRAVDGITHMRQALGRRTETYTDFGPARNHASIVIHIDLTLQNKESPLPNKSRFTLVVTPGAEKLAEDVSTLRIREGPTLSKAMVSLAEVVSNLASQPYPDRAINYGESKLTYLLQDELGGNYKTRVLVCMKPNSDKSLLGPLLQFGTQLSQVKNFPLLNDPLAQQLVTQYRARILSLQQQIGQDAGMSTTGHLHDPGEELRRIQTENLQMRDKNERLHQKLEQLQGRFGDVATSKTDLSAQLLMTEEEKLKVSKTLVEMQIENNKLKEEAEQIKFELTNKVLQLENELVEIEMDRDRHMKASRNAREKLTELEKDRKELADEYVVLKTNYLNVKKAHESEVSRNEELGIELLNMVNAKASVMRNYGKRDIGLEADQEIHRVRAIVSRLSSRKLQPEDRGNVEKSLFGSQSRFDSEINRMKIMYDDDHRKLQTRVSELTRENQDTRTVGRETQKKVSELNAKLLTQRSQVQQLQSENNRLQHKLKDVNDEFKTRLVKYVEDIAEYVDNGGVPNRKETKEMKQYVENMLKDLKKSHKVREEQLSLAAQSYRKQIEKVLRKHEELLVAYRDLRQQVEDRHVENIVLGPDEGTLQMTDSELISDQQKIINRLRDQLNATQNELEAVRLRARMAPEKAKATFADTRGNDHNSDNNNWASLRKHLREFTANTQQELEGERAELLTNNAMLEEEVKDLQEYIDSHLTRYRDEIIRLKGMLGNESTGFISPAGPPRQTDRRKNYRR